MAILGDLFQSVDIWDMVLLSSIIIMGISYVDRNRWTPLVRAAGMVLFASFWASQVIVYLDPSHPDVINGVMSFLGVLFFLFIAVHFYLDFRWEERTRSLQWLLRTSFLTGSAYFILEHITVTQGALIYAVAWLTYWVLLLFGHDVTMQEGFPEMGQGLVIGSEHAVGLSIRIVFACTAALAVFLFSAAILATRTDRKEWEPWAFKEISRVRENPTMLGRFKENGIRNLLKMTDTERKVRALLIVVPIIFITNIFRNVAVIALVYGGTMSFYDAHNVYSKILSLTMMLFLTWVLFEHLPELQEDLMGLFDLTKRVKKGMMVNGRLDLKYVKARKKKGEE